MFCDELKIQVIAGKGGDGAVAFRREKFVPRGGPSGGDGGKGGSVVFRVNGHLNTLSSLANQKIYEARNGVNGAKKNMHGANAAALVLEVPRGTVVYNEDKSEILADLKSVDDEFVVVKGGRGGLGNARFASSTHQAPRFAEKGEPGEERWICLELKLVADVGIIGLPSAGKSTFISVVSNAKPKIAAYHFTTLVPNLGVVKMSDFGGSGEESFVVADIPGLIEGASEGKGLGHQFLRHIKRNNILLHVIDGSLLNAEEDYRVVREELRRFDESLAEKQELVVLNKIDLLDEELIEEQRKVLERVSGAEVFVVSAVLKKGLKDLLWKLSGLVQEQRGQEEDEFEDFEEDKIPVLQPHLKESQFEIEKIIQKKDYKIFRITGERIERLFKMTDLENDEGLERVYHFFDKMGIKRAIEREGATYGDFVKVLDFKVPYRK